MQRLRESFGLGYGKRVTALRSQSEALEGHIQRLLTEEAAESRRRRGVSDEHREEIARLHAKPDELFERRQQTEQLESEAAAELQEERRGCDGMVQALQDWRQEAKLLSSNVWPRRPQLLMEVWVAEKSSRAGSSSSATTSPSPDRPGGSHGGGDGSNRVRFQGELWVPYEAARASGEVGVDWELPLERRLHLSRPAPGKPPLWPTAVAAGAGKNMTAEALARQLPQLRKQRRWRQGLAPQGRGTCVCMSSTAARSRHGQYMRPLRRSSNSSWSRSLVRVGVGPVRLRRPWAHRRLRQERRHSE